MDVKITFNYLNKTIQVLCKDNEELDKMYEKFTNKLNDGSEITHYIYYYEGNKLGHESTIAKNKYIANKKEINISVQKKLRIIKCPECICNDCIINLDNYIASFYGCKYDHTSCSVYDEYLNSQRIDTSEIRCMEPGCEHTQQNYTLGFYKCLTCTKMLKHSKYYCKEHKLNHDEDHEKVKYDKKNYYCENHFKKFIKYCFKDKQNLCEDCVKEHEDHKPKSYELMTPDLEKLKESLEKIEKNINNLRIIINDIKYRLDGTLRIFKRYHYIAKDIIGKFELFNKDLKNYRILKSLRNLTFSNIKINEDLNKIIYEKDLIKKTNFIIDIYKEKEKNYKGNINDIKDNIKDNDDDWLEEILKKETKKEIKPGKDLKKIKKNK